MAPVGPRSARPARAIASSAAARIRFSTVSKLRLVSEHTKTSSLPSAFARAVMVSDHRIGPRTE